MTRRQLITLATSLAAAALILGGCGSSSTGGGEAAAPAPPDAEAASAASGDIPDNQVFLRFDNPEGGYSMQYPEGWAQQGSGTDVTFADKNNVVRVAVSSGSLPDMSAVSSELSGLNPHAGVATIGGEKAVKVTYTTESAPNAVTGKTVTLMVDRYYLAHGGKLAVVDLGTPQGVDNVDAYRLMIESFKWK